MNIIRSLPVSPAAVVRYRARRSHAIHAERTGPTAPRHLCAGLRRGHHHPRRACVADTLGVFARPEADRGMWSSKCGTEACLFSVCTLCVPCVCSVCALCALCVCSVCALCALCVCSVFALRVLQGARGQPG